MSSINRRSFILLSACTFWGVATTAGSAALWKYKQRPGGDEAAPLDWPADSLLTRAADLPTLVMFAHPRCICTRSSLAELSRLMARSLGRVRALVVFFRPKGSRADWTAGDSWSMAESIAGVSVKDDEDGREAARFHGQTSGHVVLYGRNGKRLFDGGITPARGHVGDNAGLGALLALIHGQAPAQTRSAVFGCQIHDRKDDPSCGRSSCLR